MSKELISYAKRKKRNEERTYSAVKSNEMILSTKYSEEKFKLSLEELKLLNYTISKVRQDDFELKPITITVKDFCIVAGKDFSNGFNYVKVKRFLKDIADKSFWVTVDGKEKLVRWFQGVEINKGSGTITIELHHFLKPFLIGLRKNFTAIQLIHTLPMKSRYSFRLYEILRAKKYKYQNNINIYPITFEVLELKKLLGILMKDVEKDEQGTKYYNFKDFKKRCIEPAIKEINDFTDLQIERWEPKTQGRKVVSVTFWVADKDLMEESISIRKAEEALDGQMNMFNYFGRYEDGE